MPPKFDPTEIKLGKLLEIVKHLDLQSAKLKDLRNFH